MTEEVEMRTPQEWAHSEGIRIQDPDGWRQAGSPPFDQPCTFADYHARVYMCTISLI